MFHADPDSPPVANESQPEAARIHRSPIFSEPISYVVTQDDTLAGIAKLFIVRVNEIAELNGIEPGADILPGQVILIPPSGL